MEKHTRRDDAARYDNNTTNGSIRNERDSLDDSASRRDKAIGLNQLTHRELEERWPIG